MQYKFFPAQLFALISSATSFLAMHSVSWGSDQWTKQRIHEKFFTEGASAGDINGDQRLDLIAGPFWWEGPEFVERHAFAEPREFSINTYSDHFFSRVFDANADGANDVLVLGFPGKSARLYVNPSQSQLNEPWQMFEIADIVDNESPAIVDLIPGGLPEIVCGREGQFGYYSVGENATEKWTWTAISRPGTSKGRFEHGMGVGDLNGDGMLDVLNRTLWWENPGDLGGEELWKEHQWAPSNYGGGGSQICVADLDGDQDADIVTSFNAHGYGLGWFEQIRPNEFIQHNIMGETSVENDYGIAFSQLHALDVTDIDGDGREDIVTGKRYWAHQGHDVGGLQSPVLYWFRNVAMDSSDKIDFVPTKIDGDSGVGVEVLVCDLDEDHKPDVVTSSKRGLFVHRQRNVPTPKQARLSKWNNSKGKDQSKYADGLAPEEAAKRMLVPDGFAVDLVACEPELTQPIAMCFDAKGRIWVVEGHTYPTKAPEGEGRDRIIILSDEDANGSFETKKTFLEDINLASGIEVGFGGVWIGAAPELLFVPDENQDDIPDSEPVVLLDGWGFQDTHETLNSFTWGPDGWLYGCHGVFTHSRVGKPGSKDEDRIALNAGVWRYHPTQHRFEVFAHGTSNPWGLDYNAQGDWFVTACVIPHLYHIQQGGRYQRQAGPHFNSYTYDDIKTIADHAHYVGQIKDHAFWGPNSIEKPPAPLGTSMLGGGHAHCGLAIYNANSFPEKYQDALLFHNLHGHRLVRERVEHDGSGYIGMHRPDFALAQDHREIGVGVMVGPDGALYTSDWHDVQTCHNRSTEVWDRTNGRIFRIRYGEVIPQQFNLWDETDLQLVERLGQGGFFARQARRILQERFFNKLLDSSQVAEALDALLESDVPHVQLQSLWAKHCIGAIDSDQLKRFLLNSNPYVRAWAVHFIGEQFQPSPDSTAYTPSTTFDFTGIDFKDPNPVVRRYWASILQRLPVGMRWPILEALCSYTVDGADRNIPWLVWYGLEPLVDVDTSRAYSLAKRSRWPNIARYVIRRSAATRQGRDNLIVMLRSSNQQEQQTILEELQSAANARAGLEKPKNWSQVASKLLASKLPRIQQLTMALSVQFGDETALPLLRSMVSNREESIGKRRDALKALRNAKDPQLESTLLVLLNDESFSADAAKGLADFDSPDATSELLNAYPGFSSEAKLATLSTLVSRRTSARRLVAEMEKGKIRPDEVPAFIIRQALALEDAELGKRLERVWGTITNSTTDMRSEYAKYRDILKPAALDKASAARGRKLYQKNCGQCHQLFGVGGTIGPAITGANRSDANYWLENILEPNLLIGKAYQVTNFLTEDDRVVSGIVRSENEDAVTVQTATEELVLAKSEIARRSSADVSLMPSGQLKPLSDQQVQDLFKYLMAPQQVRLPGEKSSANNLPSGSFLLEGEAFRKVKVTDGTAQPQAMHGFGPYWSGDSQLWWTGAKPGAKLTWELDIPKEGRFNIHIQWTQAVDYGKVRVSIPGLEVQELDLFDPKVSLSAETIWSGVELKNEDLIVTVEILGANAKAVPSYMVGIDFIALEPVQQ